MKRTIATLVAGLAVTGACLTLPALAENAPAQIAQASETSSADLNDNRAIPEISSFYVVDPIETITVAQNVAIPDDLLVTIMVAKAANCVPTKVNALRKESKSWAVVMQELKVSPNFMFTWLGTAEVTAPGASGVVAFNRFLCDPDKYPLYDKTMRNVTGIDYLVRIYKMTPTAAMKALSESKDAMTLIDAHANK